MVRRGIGMSDIQPIRPSYVDAAGPQARAAHVSSTDDLFTAITNSNSVMGGDALDLAAYCLYDLTNLQGQLPLVTQPLVVHGNHATIRRTPSATALSRIFEVGSTSLTLDTATAMNGDLGNNRGGGGRRPTLARSLLTSCTALAVGPAFDLVGALTALAPRFFGRVWAFCWALCLWTVRPSGEVPGLG
ncbi:hypothetical protein [Streptomyces sp. NPDC086787]|uniref:hypothetical protein n=1 Tax=Streptomyces sp. NPDC086787 TaxID=3365759 RepID=UPI0038296B3F